MKSRNFFPGLAAAAGMLVLILDSRTALEGMSGGIEICIHTLIPSLFPFFVLSVYMTGNLIGKDLIVLRPLCALLGIPSGAESLLVTGFLGGYPTGAQSVAQAYEQQRLSRQKAEHLLAFCSNAGPAFLFGVVGQAFDSVWAAWGLWLIHIASALLTGFLSKGPSDQVVISRENRALSLSQAMKTAIAVMAQVCGWAVVFRMLLCYLDRWFVWLLPDGAQVLLSGMLEFSNGCLRLRELEGEGVRFVTASAMTAFGGICVALQTRSVVGQLSLRFYFAGKLLQTCLSILMAGFLVRSRFSPVLLAVICLICLISIRILRKTEKNSSIPAAIGV